MLIRELLENTTSSPVTKETYLQKLRKDMFPDGEIRITKHLIKRTNQYGIDPNEIINMLWHAARQHGNVLKNIPLGDAVILRDKTGLGIVLKHGTTREQEPLWVIKTANPTLHNVQGITELPVDSLP